jgi:hypothetical protein
MKKAVPSRVACYHVCSCALFHEETTIYYICLQGPYALALSPNFHSEELFSISKATWAFIITKLIVRLYSVAADFSPNTANGLKMSRDPLLKLDDEHPTSVKEADTDAEQHSETLDSNCMEK